MSPGGASEGHTLFPGPGHVAASGLSGLGFPALAGQAGLLLVRRRAGGSPPLRQPPSRELSGWNPQPPGSGPGGLGQRGPMALGAEQRLGSLVVFTRDDFEGDWRPVARGGFSQVFQARHKRWRTEYAIKCSPGLLPDATRYLCPRPPFTGGHSQGAPREGPAGLRIVPSLSKLYPVAELRRLSGLRSVSAAGATTAVCGGHSERELPSKPVLPPSSWHLLGRGLLLVALCHPPPHPQNLRAGRAVPAERLWRWLRDTQ